VNDEKNARIYLDSAATTPVRVEAAQAMRQALVDGAFNPSSLHAEGRRARAVVDAARERVAAVLGAPQRTVTFTSSGTEADNMAILGAMQAARGGSRCHFVTTVIEHHAVLHAFDAAAAAGAAVTVLPVDESGTLDPDAFSAALRDDTLLASVMYANNEVGAVQPIARLAAIARERGVLFHTDAVQAPSWLPIRVDDLGVDLLSLSAHKFGGPKGSGVLYVRSGVALVPIVHGGGQEFGRRAGTENVAGIAGLACALELAAAEREAAAARIAGLRDRLEAGLRAAIPDLRINAAGAVRLPNVTSVSFAGIDADALLMRLDLDGVAASAGSACTSGALEPSHVVAALGIDPRWHGGTLRFSLAPATTGGEIDRALKIVANAVESLRKLGAPA
jgi:cysteine desulfurase